MAVYKVNGVRYRVGDDIQGDKLTETLTQLSEIDTKQQQPATGVTQSQQQPQPQIQPQTQSLQKSNQVKTPEQVPAQNQAQQPVDFSLSEMVSNIPSSAAEFAKNIIQPFLHPIDTIESMFEMGQAINQKAGKFYAENIPNVLAFDNKINNFLSDLGVPIERVPEDPSKMTFPKEVLANQLGKFIDDRYGSIDNFKKTMMDDPVGALADASMLLTAGGSAGSKLPGIIGQVGQKVETIGKAIEPINLAKGSAKFGAAKVISKEKPVDMFESSAKFSTTFSKSKRKQLAETALKHGVLPTSKGVDKLNDIIGNFDTRIEKLVDTATQKGHKIPVKALFGHLKSLRKKLGGAKLEGASDLKQIDQVARKLHTHLTKQKITSLTPNELQDLKQDIYKRINFDAKQLRAGVGQSEARKAIARKTKEAIEKVADVKDLNRELGRLLELKEPLQRSAGRIENRNIISIDAPIKIGAGQAAGGVPGAAAGTGMAIFENPKVKAKLALKIKKIQDAGQLNLIDHKLLPTLVHLGLLQAGRLDDIENTK